MFRELAAIPLSFGTAAGSLDAMDCRPGDTILIRGGTSALGLAAISLAKHVLGCTVLATTRSAEAKAGLLAAGADVALVEPAIRDRVRALHPEGVDCALDCVGEATLKDTMRCVRRGGVMCQTGALTHVPGFGLRLLGEVPASVKLTCFESDILTGACMSKVIDRVLEAIQQDALSVPLDPVAFTLEEYGDADLRLRIWHQLGAALRKVHAAPLGAREQSYALGYDGEGPTESWDQHLAAVLPVLTADRTLGLTDGQKTRLTAALTRFDLGRNPLGLCHGDLKLDNVLVRGDAVVAILDWELARYVPAAAGEFSTSVEPAVLASKIPAVARTAAEREALRHGLGSPDAADLWTFYLSDVATNLRWFPVALASRPDREILRERFDRYMAGVREDLAPLL